MSIIVWKDGSWMLRNGPTWEYENDVDWLVTIPVTEMIGAAMAMGARLA